MKQRKENKVAPEGTAANTVKDKDFIKLEK